MQQHTGLDGGIHRFRGLGFLRLLFDCVAELNNHVPPEQSHCLDHRQRFELQYVSPVEHSVLNRVHLD